MTAPTGHECHSIHICEMLERLGLELGCGQLLGLSYATALHRCEDCPAEQACRDWLATKPTSTVLAPRFCPNADIFLEFQADQFGPRRQN
ncbi:MAG: DUF6455 family protein [Xanthobacteraceae bacterium]|jgi:hypothetical protein